MRKNNSERLSPFALSYNCGWSKTHDCQLCPDYWPSRGTLISEKDHLIMYLGSVDARGNKRAWIMKPKKDPIVLALLSFLLVTPICLLRNGCLNDSLRGRRVDMGTEKKIEERVTKDDAAFMDLTRRGFLTLEKLQSNLNRNKDRDKRRWKIETILPRSDFSDGVNVIGIGEEGKIAKSNYYIKSYWIKHPSAIPVHLKPQQKFVNPITLRLSPYTNVTKQIILRGNEEVTISVVNLRKADVPHPGEKIDVTISKADEDDLLIYLAVNTYCVYQDKKLIHIWLAEEYCPVVLENR